MKKRTGDPYPNSTKRNKLREDEAADELRGGLCSRKPGPRMLEMGAKKGEIQDPSASEKNENWENKVFYRNEEKIPGSRASVEGNGTTGRRRDLDARVWQTGGRTY